MCPDPGMYLCNKHRMQYRTYGYFRDNNPRSVYDPNEIHIQEDVALIDIYNQRSEKTYIAIIDMEDVGKIKGHKWRITIKKGKPYVVTGHGAGNQRYLARFLLDYNGPLEVDHIDGNTLNNRKSNLRILTHDNNVSNLKPKLTNKFGIRGISQDKRNGKYLVDFSYKKDRYFVKPWETFECAVACRYYLEVYLNPIFRFTPNDQKILNIVDALPQASKEEIRQYVLAKIQQHEKQPDNELYFSSKAIVDEDFIQYKNPSMFISNTTCTFKCDKENCTNLCINSSLYQMPTIKIRVDDLIQRYLSNQITSSVVFGGLENFDEFEQLFNFVVRFRQYSQDDIVIYTGYNKEEISNKILALKQFPNIIVKFGRFIPNHQPHYDPVLGICLASDNQFAEVIS